jgi:hypothetical protein
VVKIKKEQDTSDLEIAYYEGTGSTVPKYLLEERPVNLGERDKITKSSESFVETDSKPSNQS